MNSSEKEFINYWRKHRSKWNWGKTFKTGVLYYGFPIVLLIDFINFFVIEGLNYAFLSFTHLFRLLITALWISVVTGFIYGFVNWNMNERKYWKIIKRERTGD